MGAQAGGLSQDPPSEPPPGRSVGGYRLVRPLGRGGMAEVWLGRHEVTRGLAAVKILRTRAAAAVHALFSTEGRALLRLRHPNIIPVFDVGEDYIATAYVEGVDLRHRMRSPIPPAEAVRVACAIGSALATAHADGVVHCDVKPGNILLDRSGTPFLADFGIARILDDGEDGEDEGAVGTPAYMAPEQASGRPSPAADQYSLARTLVAMLLGRTPPLHPGEAVALLPEPLRGVLGPTLSRAMAIFPEERFEDVGMLVERLRSADLGDTDAPPLLVSLARDPERFAWAAHPFRVERIGESILRADYRLNELESAGHIDPDGAADFRARSGYADFTWSMYARSERLGPIHSAEALARAHETIVLLHGLFVDREIWRDVSIGIALNNGLAVTLTPDLMGFAGSPLRHDAPASACSPAGLVRGVRAWLALIGLDETPTISLGHSFSAAAMMCVRDAELGSRIHRVCVTPVLFWHRLGPRLRARFHAAMAFFCRIVPRPLVRRLARFMFRRDPSLSRTRIAVRDAMAESALRLGFRRVGHLFWSVAGARPAPPEELVACTVVTTHDDPLVSPEETRATIQAAGVPPERTYRLVYGGHFPQLVDEEHPEWGARNVHELVSVVDSVLDMTRTAVDRSPGSDAETVQADPPALPQSTTVTPNGEG